MRFRPAGHYILHDTLASKALSSSSFSCQFVSLREVQFSIYRDTYCDNAVSQWCFLRERTPYGEAPREFYIFLRLHMRYASSLSLRLRESDAKRIAQGVIVGGSISVHLFMSGVGSLRSSHVLVYVCHWLNYVLALIGSSGCLVQIANDDLWIALAILIYSESRKRLYVLLTSFP